VNFGSMSFGSMSWQHELKKKIEFSKIISQKKIPAL
jgi:hypothetical protein